MRRFLLSLLLVCASAAALGGQTCDSLAIRVRTDGIRAERARLAGILQPAHVGTQLDSNARSIDSIAKARCVPPSLPNAKPVANWSHTCPATPTTTAGNYRCVFDASSSKDADGNITSFQWRHSAEAPRTGVSIVWGFAAGTYTVTLLVTDDSSATDSLTKQFTVGSGTPAPPSPTPPPPTPTPPPPNPNPAPPTGPVPIVPAALPRDSVDVTWRAPTGRTLTVAVGGSFQAAIDSARRGDEIVLQAGATYSGNFILKVKSGTGWILVRTSQLAQLPPLGSRIDTLVDAPKLAKVESPAFGAAIATQPAASGWRLVGLEITSAPSIAQQGALVLFGDGSNAQNTLAKVPTDLILDRVWVHGTSTLDVRRCVGLYSARSAVVNSALTDCHAKGSDSQAILGYNGPGPYRIENNYLEGAGENIMFGGADPQIPNLIPSDITIRGNHFFKPVSWKTRWTIKNSLELKCAKRVLIEGNVFDGSWTDGQTGVLVLFKSVNQSGSATWCQTADVVFRGNVARNGGAGISVHAKPEVHPAVPAARFLFEENIFEEVGTFAGTTNGRMIYLGSNLADVEIRHNTLIHNAIAGQFILMENNSGVAAKHLVVKDNVATWGGPWGAVMGQAPQGSQALALYAPTYDFRGNVVIGLPGNLVSWYPASNAYPAQVAQVGFVDAAAGNYALGVTSPHKGKATGGRDPGADIATVRARAQRAVAGR